MSLLVSGVAYTINLSGTGITTQSTWSSLAIGPTGQTVTIPNNLQMTGTLTPSAGSNVVGSNFYWQDTGGGSASTWAVVNSPANVPSYQTSWNTTASKTLGAVSNTLNHLLVVEAMGYYSGGAQTFTISDTNTDTFSCSTLVQGFSNTINAQICVAVVNATASNTITCAVSAGYSLCAAKELSGNKTTSPLDVSAAATSTGSGTAAMTTALFTTSGSNEFIDGFCFDAYGSGTSTVGTGYTKDWSATSGLSAIGEHQITGGAGSYALTATDGATSLKWACDAVALLPSTAGTGFYSTINQSGLLTAQNAGTSTVAVQGGGVVQSTSANYTGSVSTATATFTNAQTPGNLNVLKVGWDAASGSIAGVTDAAGNSYACTTPEQANSLSAALCYAAPIVAYSAAGGNIITVNFTAAVASPDIVAEERNYPPATSVVDGTVVNATGTSGGPSASYTTTNATDVVIAGVQSAQQVQTANSPFALDLADTGGGSILSAPAFSAGSYTASGTVTGGNWVEQVLAFKVLSSSTTVTVAAQAVSNVYYMAPSNATPPGNDSNACTQALPCLSWTHVMALEKANCPGASGCQIILENGTYNTANGTGYLNLNAASGGNAASGTSSAPIIITAQNERQAWVMGDGTAEPLQINNAAYIQILGLRIGNGDFSAEPDCTGNSGASNLYINNSSNITVQRNVLDHDNRYCNAMLSFDWQSTNVNYIENEFYYFHRHAIDSSYGNGNHYIRNYFNSRNYADLPGCTASGAGGTGRCSEACCTDRGDSAISLYPAQNIVADDNISEGNEDLYNIEATQSSGTCPQTGGAGNLANGNSFWGGISYNDNYGAILQHSRGSVAADGPVNTNYEDIVSINNEARGAVGSYIRSPVASNAASGGTTVNRMSLFGNASNPTTLNFGSDQDSCNTGGGTYLLNVKNTLAVNAAVATGISINSNGGIWSGTVQYNNAYGNKTQFVLAGSMTNANNSTLNPLLAGCQVYVPASSPMHGAGISGSDIGAGMLYEHDLSGNVTTTKLWDSSFSPPRFIGQGGTIPGLNDVAGASLFDVFNRVGPAGCVLPGGF